jgi:putative acetyltransferase
MITIRDERPDDAEAIRRVHLLAFGQPDEADLVDALRQEGEVVLSMVADQDSSIVGHVVFSRLAIRADQGVLIPALALAPMAVLPASQRQGIGSMLLTASLDQCRRRRERVVIVVGHTNYYPRFGFSNRLTAQLRSRFQCDAFMGLELEPGVLDGVTGTAEYAAPFARLQ